MLDLAIARIARARRCPELDSSAHAHPALTSTPLASALLARASPCGTHEQALTSRARPHASRASVAQPSAGLVRAHAHAARASMPLASARLAPARPCRAREFALGSLSTEVNGWRNLAWLWARFCGKTQVADGFHFFIVPIPILRSHNSIWEFRNPSDEFRLVPSYFLIFPEFPYFK